MPAEKRSNNLIIVLGLLTAVVGGGLVLLLLTRGGDSGTTPSAGSDNVPVLVAKRAIALGTAGADLGDAVEVKQVPAVARASDALVSLGELTDRATTVDIGPDQQLRGAFFRQRTVRGDSIKVPDGMQAVAMTIPFTNGGGGYVGPGDHVNFYALVGKQNGTVMPLCSDGLCASTDPKAIQAVSQLVLSNVQILDVSQEVAPATVTSVKPTAGQVARTLNSQSSVTYLMALDASQAEKAIFFSRYGEVYLTLVPRGQADSATAGRDQTNALKP